MVDTSKVENSKQKVFFDTSFLIGLRKNELNIDIDKEFPISDWMRLVQDTFIDEFWGNSTNWSQKLSAAEFFEKNNLYLLASTDEILLNEYLTDGKADFQNTNQLEVLSFLKGEHKKQIAREEYYDKMVYDRTLANKHQWYSIPISDKDKVIIDTTKIHERISMLLTSDIAFSMPLDSMGRHFLRILNNKAFLSSCNSIVDVKDHVRTCSDLKGKFPTIYNILTYSIFTDCLMRPKTIFKKNNRNIRSSFDISLMGCNEDILISENLLPDFRISLPTLYYSDIFATCDKHQANLVKYLYPGYEKKIKLITF